ncbi:MAG: hypothetical protein ACK559_01805, partial [bacterium]
LGRRRPADLGPGEVVVHQERLRRFITRRARSMSPFAMYDEYALCAASCDITRSLAASRGTNWSVGSLWRRRSSDR